MSGADKNRKTLGKRRKEGYIEEAKVTITKRRKGSNYVPEEIKREILLRLPVKSLVRFRSVDKMFRRLISTQQFITDHLKTFRCEEDELLLLGQGRSKTLLCHLFLDGLIPTHIEDIGISYKTLNYSKIRLVGYCNGVVCLICHSYRRSTRAVLFLNPSIRKAVVIPASDHLSRDISSPIFGFGYVEDDYKLVVLPHTSKSGASLTAKVFSLKTRNWETVVCSWSQPQDPQHRYWKITSKRQVFVEGACHWLAKDFDVNGRFTYFVLSFHLGGNHTIGKIVLPRSLCDSIHVYDGCLSVITHNELWVMNKFDSTWTRIIKRVNLRGLETRGPNTIVGFTGGGGVLYNRKYSLNGCTCEELLFYNPTTDTKQLLKKNHGYEILYPYRLYAYRQNLGLLDQDEN